MQNTTISNFSNERLFSAPTRAYGILRSEQRKQFTVIDQRTIQDNNLSLKAHSILLYLLSMPSNWQFNVNHLCNQLRVGRYTIEKCLRELVQKGYVFRQRIRDELGRFIGSFRVVKERPDCVGKVVNGEVLNPDGDFVLSTNRFSTSGFSIAGKSDNLINTKNSIIKKEITQNLLTKVAVDVSISSNLTTEEKITDLINSEMPQTPSAESIQTESLVNSEPLEKKEVLATCDKKAHKKNSCDKFKSQKLQNQLTTNEHHEYKAKLAAIGVAIQNVEWVICQIDPQEREKVVTNAIVWLSEQKWVQQPAAVFVEAVRQRKRSAQTVDQELRQIIDDNKPESKQFAEWFDGMKTSRLVEQAASHPEHYATVVITQKAAELLTELRQKREFAELEQLTEGDRNERLAEMERLELAGEIKLPSYGVTVPWKEARQLLECL